jgi:hypothetical protein
MLQVFAKPGGDFEEGFVSIQEDDAGRREDAPTATKDGEEDVAYGDFHDRADNGEKQYY